MLDMLPISAAALRGVALTRGRAAAAGLAARGAYTAAAAAAAAGSNTTSASAALSDDEFGGAGSRPWVEGFDPDAG